MFSCAVPRVIALGLSLISSLSVSSASAAQRASRSSAGSEASEVSAGSFARSPLLQVSNDAVVSFGGSADSSDLEFSQTSGYHVVLALARDRVLFLDGSRAHVVSLSGHLERTIGREGSGPGEYRALASACATSTDSLLLFDATLRRVSVLDATGAFVRSARMESVGAMYPGACLNDGRFLLARTELGRDRRLTIALHIADRDGIRSQEVARQDLGPALPEIFRGRVSVFTHGDRIYLARGGRASILELRLDGSVSRELSLQSLAPTLSESEWWRVLESRVPAQAGATRRAAAQERYGALPKPDTWPAFERVFPDGDGGLWIELSHTGSTRAEEWLHLNEAWQPVGRLRLSPPTSGGRTIVGFLGASVFVRQFDPDGFVVVSRHLFSETVEGAR